MAWMESGPMTLIDASSGEEKNDDVRASGCASNEADGANARARWTTRTRDDDADGAQKL